jgi:hypothetical protein
MESQNQGYDQMNWLLKRMNQDPLDSMSSEMKSNTSLDSLKFVNTCGIFYFLVVTFIIVTTSFSVTVPALYEGSAYWTRVAIGILILIQVCFVQYLWLLPFNYIVYQSNCVCCVLIYGSLAIASSKRID